MRPNPTPLAVLLRNLDRAGLSLRLEGERIRVKTLSLLTPELAERIRNSREDVVELLRIHGPALLPLFREPALPLSEPEQRLLAENAADIRASRGDSSSGVAA